MATAIAAATLTASASAAASLAGTAAQAEPWGCTFTVECQAGAGCAAAGFEAEVIAADHEGQLFVSTVTGDSPVSRLSEPGALPATYASAGRQGLSEMISIGADGTSVMTLHVFDGTAEAVTYFGTCEVLQ